MEKQEKKISVIVPVYNVEKYLRKCLDSLLCQTYKNLEIILIEDCSTDNSLQICQEYEKNNSNITLLQNKVNHGLSYNRNKGIKKATGDYIGFIDSDDYVSENYYECLAKAIIKNDADIAVCDINLVFPYSQERKKCGDIQGKTTSFINNGLVASACNKLFKINLFDHISFEVGKYNEDIAVVVPLLLKANKVVYEEKVFYNYVQRNNSIQNSPLSEKKLDIFAAISLTLQRIRNVENYDYYKESILFQQLISFIMYVPEKEKNFLTRYKFLKKFRKYSKIYCFSDNSFFKEEIRDKGRIYTLYYSLLVKFIDLGFILFATILISMRLLYQKKNKPIIKKGIRLEDIVEQAKKQNVRKDTTKKVSVVIPNYNYSQYLYQRVYSILYQDYKIDEIIILDDCSTDNSREMIDELIDSLKQYVHILSYYNSKNQGKACIQWEKGMKLATMPYVWIAEADDYSDPKFLKKVMEAFKDDKVILSYTDTAFINSTGQKILNSISKEIDIMKTGHWKKDYVNNGIDEFMNYTFLNCTIANVSSTVIKKDNYQEAFNLAKQYKQAGDWMFYSNLMQKGKIAYIAYPYNYYRVHTNNVSTITKKEDHFNEIKRIHCYFDEKFHLNEKQKKEIDKRYQFLKNVWQLGEMKK